MKKILGISALVILICVITTIVNPNFVLAYNLQNLIRRTALFGIIGVGAAFVIITGGIDLSIGSVVGLTGCLLAMFLSVSYTASPEQLTIVRVDGQARVLILDGAAGSLKVGDRLQLDVDVGTSRRRPLTVADMSPEEGQTRVRVSESLPAALAVPSPVTVLQMRHMNVVLAVSLVLVISVGIGLVHGLLITKLRLQPFVVTLCGLLFYRGAARLLTEDQLQGFGNRFIQLKYLANGEPFSVPVPLLKWISEGHFGRWKWDDRAAELALDQAGNRIALDVIEWVAIPMPALILLVIAVAAGVFLNWSVYGRYLLALGRNEQAARYSGINTDRMIILAYVICALLAGLAGILFALYQNSVQPVNQGNFYELYAIAAAVLGGCSLRGGEGSILGVVIGAALMRLLYNSITLMQIQNQAEFLVIGLVILIGVIVDELVKRLAARRRARQEASHAEAPRSPPPAETN